MELMPTYFEPRKRGRRPLYDVTPILGEIQDLPVGQWGKYELPEKHARSAKRQLDKLGFDSAVEETKEGFFLFVKKLA